MTTGKQEPLRRLGAARGCARHLPASLALVLASAHAAAAEPTSDVVVTPLPDAADVPADGQAAHTSGVAASNAKPAKEKRGWRFWRRKAATPAPPRPPTAPPPNDKWSLIAPSPPSQPGLPDSGVDVRAERREAEASPVRKRKQAKPATRAALRGARPVASRVPASFDGGERPAVEAQASQSMDAGRAGSSPSRIASDLPRRAQPGADRWIAPFFESSAAEPVRRASDEAPSVEAATHGAPPPEPQHTSQQAIPDLAPKPRQVPATPTSPTPAMSPAWPDNTWKFAASFAGLLGVAGFASMARRKRKGTMQMSRASNQPAPEAKKPTGDRASRAEPRVAMLTTAEIWAPNHPSHQMPWKAPAGTESGIAHRYHVSAPASDSLLFVDDATQEEAIASAPRLEEPMLLDAVYVPAEPVAPGPLLLFTTMDAAEAASDGGAKSAAPAPTSPERAPVEAAVLLFATSDEGDAATHGGAKSATPAAASPERTPVSTGAPIPTQTSGSTPDKTPPESPDSASPRATAHPVAVPLVPLDSLTLGPGQGAPSQARQGDEPSAGHDDSGASARPVEDTAPSAVPIAHAVDDASSCRSLEEAQALIEAGNARGALPYLDALRNQPEAPLEAWILASWGWTQIAQETGASTAYAQAADALECVLARDASQPGGWQRLAQLRLLQAGLEGGAERIRLLDATVAASRMATEQAGSTDAEAFTLLGEALAERAAATPSDDAGPTKASRFADAVAAFRQAHGLVRDPSSAAAWNLQEALQAQARVSPTLEAAKLRMQADALLAEGLRTIGEDDRALWYAAKVRNELAHAELAGGATRALHLRTFRTNYRDVLTGPDATPDMLLSWLELISLEITHLRGEAARSRFAEGDAIFQRLDAMLPGNVHVAMARARLLRRRAAQGGEGSRATALTEALQCLVPFVEHADASFVRLEAAEVLLERAACLPVDQARGDFDRAEALALSLSHRPGTVIPATRCIIEARLGRALPVESTLRDHLAETGRGDARAQWTLARLALRENDARAACAYCEAAAKLLAEIKPDAAQMQVWEQASRQWAAGLPDAMRDAAWQANRQRLRAAG